LWVILGETLELNGLRVIAGRWKGLGLTAPSGEVARPTTDRVKESMFNLMGFAWRGDVTVDLFAGSGALGIEALSRGAGHAVFADRSVASVHAVQENLRRCQAAADHAFVWRTDWKQAWARVAELGYEVGWVFVDPPYKMNLWHEVLQELGSAQVPILDGVVCEHPRTQSMPMQVGNLKQWKHKVYGDIGVTLYDMPMDAEARGGT